MKEQIRCIILGHTYAGNRMADFSEYAAVSDEWSTFVERTGFQPSSNDHINLHDLQKAANEGRTIGSNIEMEELGDY